MKKTLVFMLVLPLLWSSSVAQKRATSGPGSPAGVYKLLEVKVVGTQRYTEKEIIPAAGLQLGQNAGEGDFKEAVQRLGNTGLFSGISFSFSYSSAGAKLELQFEDTDEKKLAPAHFENFVWFTDAELASELGRRVPLFKGKLPLSGGLPDSLSEALQTMLDEKQIPARVDYLREAPEGGGDLTGFAYRVTELGISIREVEFPGAAPDQVPLLTAAARKLIGADYVRSSLAVIARIDLLPVYLQRGYLKASFGPTGARVVTPKSPAAGEMPNEVQVVAIFPVTPGSIYSVSSVAWSGNSALPIAQLQPLLHLPVGQPANAVRLDRDLENVGKLYHARGYMAVRVQPVPKMDDEKNTVHYDLIVTEGDQFKMGELEILGLDTQSKARMESAWALREGEPYNADYPKKFLDENFRLIPGAANWNASVHEAVNNQDKTVDVTLRFSAR